DNLVNLESVEHALAQSFPSIEFIGFHFTGVNALEHSAGKEDKEGFLAKVFELTEKAKSGQKKCSD
nr:hypothetical protein [bacterium]